LGPCPEQRKYQCTGVLMFCCLSRYGPCMTSRSGNLSLSPGGWRPSSKYQWTTTRAFARCSTGFGLNHCIQPCSSFWTRRSPGFQAASTRVW
jgi:hypothetical protein